MISAIVQARVGSTRFPDKIFADLCGKPMIWHIINRLKFSKKINNIILATTTNPLDDKLVKWAKENDIKIFRGSENNVLSRFYEAAKENKPDVIVRVTADDPFKDPVIIDEVIDLLEKKNLDFAYNNNPPSFPEGLDTEVFKFSALENAEKNSEDPFEREHVTQYFYCNPGKFSHKNYSCDEDLSDLRWTVDTKDDYEMVKKIYEALYKEDKIFLFKDILEYLSEHPEVSSMNSDVARSLMYKK